MEDSSGEGAQLRENITRGRRVLASHQPGTWREKGAFGKIKTKPSLKLVF